MRLRLDLAYDGGDFHGWATQPGLRTVQGTLEAALAAVLRVPHARLTVAGRTDSGVHARGQVAHLDLDDADLAAVSGRLEQAPEVALTRRLAGALPEDVRVRRITRAPVGFDARFSASWRRYAYRIADRPSAADPLRRRHVLTWRRELDESAMNAASATLLGLQDFAAFCRPREGATTVRTLQEFEWRRTPTHDLEARIVADAFCHHMVRSLVGCLIAVGEGRRAPDWAGQVLAGRDRSAGGAVAHAHGLTLEEVGYPPDAELAARADAARRRRDPMAPRPRQEQRA